MYYIGKFHFNYTQDFVRKLSSLHYKYITILTINSSIPHPLQVCLYKVISSQKFLSTQSSFFPRIICPFHAHHLSKPQRKFSRYGKFFQLTSGRCGLFSQLIRASGSRKITFTWQCAR